ncbi:TDP-N-acetylfucosamine:lipid II N-acetylfucosaminyltransferase [Parasegetibacter sp. NRK P23]|uniref:TDP-N-acetylfucosamine:lipid II N-acetylfucosaminyltransferase n=1 Tax=Parasegetibacter sp. NRK P23 TaxID=2942999 RepID=UPI002042DBB2|nr:TDP-N-acetylfucosamine:lipid II N-acetylfucosaminyltransferase [Parasegetibacter sp. NRK P23]MCM5527633.1 TDP-N-acetylfucosamine:lipid II N-acetylfucosaminyltransferase [Parasegetibacter sp. NRK P23]
MAGEKSILHLMPDDKFIDYFIEQSETVAPGKSDYWILSASTDNALKYVKYQSAKRVVSTKSSLRVLKKQIRSYRKIVLHSFLMPDVKVLVGHLKKEQELIWMFWGADGYRFTHVRRRWYQPLTWKQQRAGKLKNVGVLRRLYRGGFALYKAVLAEREARAIIRRVDTCATWVQYDYEMLRFINPHMKWVYYSYFTANQMGLEHVPVVRNDYTKLWLGNSATDTNNHFDAIDFLSKHFEGEVFVPLSYGDAAYAERLQTYAKERLGDRFVAVTAFMSLNEYHLKMNSCGIVWMNHIRQQAGGNVLAALYMGKAVIMNKQNNLYKTLQGWGAKLMEQESILNIKELAQQEFVLNRNIITENLSIERSLQGIAELYQ